MAKKPKPIPQVHCPYCGQRARWVNNEEIYGRRYGASRKAYWCQPCDAYVGCHENTKHPKGTLANKETREARVRAHAAFDPLWMPDNRKRGRVYAEIAAALGRVVHIGESTVEQCREIVEWATARAGHCEVQQVIER